VQHGITIAREMARLDIGQGCVVRKGTVLAVEAFEGTDDMLRRAGTFKTDETLFVKTVKARQDFRFDVPVFGLRTLESHARLRPLRRRPRSRQSHRPRQARRAEAGQGLGHHPPRLLKSFGVAAVPYDPAAPRLTCTFPREQHLSAHAR
jgi:hypothetical protein